MVQLAPTRGRSGRPMMMVVVGLRKEIGYRNWSRQGSGQLLVRWLEETRSPETRWHTNKTEPELWIDGRTIARVIELW